MMKNLVRCINKTEALEYTTHIDNSEELIIKLKMGCFKFYKVSELRNSRLQFKSRGVYLETICNSL